MGLFDFLFDLRRRPGADRDKVAIAIDLEAGVLEECPVCRTVFDRQHDERLPAADQIARQSIERRDARVAVFAGDLDDLCRRLRSVRDRFDFSCTCQQGG